VTSEADVLVVGGGPVGLAIAIEAGVRGLDVALIEPRVGTVDKACGEGLMPGAVEALTRLGVHPVGHPLEGIRYRDARRSVDHRFVGRVGLGVRRTTLHDALARRADDLGIVRHAGRVNGLAQDGEGVVVTVSAVNTLVVPGDFEAKNSHAFPSIESPTVTMRARWLLAADGLHSAVRRLVGASRASLLPRHRRRFGVRTHFQVEPWTSLVEVYWSEGGEAYVTPVDKNLVGVAMLGAPGLNFSAQLASIPSLAERLADAAIVGSVRGAGPLDQRTRSRVVGRVLLVGDAAGYVDALTGEGLRVGFAQAHAAVDAIISAAPQSYERAWARATRDYRILTRGLVAVAVSPLRRAIVPSAAAMPGVFGSVIERLAR